MALHTCQRTLGTRGPLDLLSPCQKSQARGCQTHQTSEGCGKLPHLNPVNYGAPGSAVAPLPSGPVYMSGDRVLYCPWGWHSACFPLLGMAHSRSHLPICPSIHLSVCPSICTDPVSCLNGTCARLGAVPGLRTCSSLPAGVLVNSPSHRIFFSHLSALPLIGISVLRVRGLQMHPKYLCLQGAEDLNSGVPVCAQQGSRPRSSLPPASERHFIQPR